MECHNDVFEKNRKAAFELWEKEWKNLIPYTLSVDNLKPSEISKCDLTNRKIILANSVLNSNGFNLVQLNSVFAHEVAHAIVGTSHETDDGHNDEWKQKNIELGGNGRIQDCIPNSYIENHFFFSRVDDILKTIPQDQDISKEKQINAQKEVLKELINEGYNPTELLQMYMKECTF